MSAKEKEVLLSVIDLYRDMPYLWQKDHKDYLNKDIRNEDDAIKKEICFSETLIVSCGHYEGTVVADESEQEWSCTDTLSEQSEEIKEDKLFEVRDRVEEEAKVEEEEEDENDFQIYFFPDCNLPEQLRDSKDSIMIVNGMPKINPAAAHQFVCTCEMDKKGDCTCHTKLPCRCGAKTTRECKCEKLKNICICHETKPPAPVCVCKGSDVCLCHPDGIQAICKCEDIEKPCICDKTKFPFPVCTCKRKPKFGIDESKSSILGEGEYEGEGEEMMDYKHLKLEEPSEASDPCLCQKKEPVPPCLCMKGKKCDCKEDMCICGVQKSCVCEPTESQEQVPCRSEESRTICSCPEPQECTCGASSDNCKCFPKPKNCTCGDPENCKCFIPCDCTDPCICDTKTKTPQVCDCPETITCTCDGGGKDYKRPKQLKRVRAGKHGYRWCHSVDPKHTYFDYGYDRYDKINAKEQEKEKFKILGLHDDKEEEDTCAVHGVKAPPYEKKVRKASLDCCSAVGGISISLETLGEDKDKFLVQVVSHSSKEGAKTGSKLVSIMDTNLHTMEENRTEHITKQNITKERRNYMAICETGYYNKVTRICGERNVVRRLYHTFDVARNFLLEGANVVLLRYFGLRRYRGNVKTQTVLMDGTICESIYVCLGVSQAIVNGKPLFVCKVERHIIEPNGYIHQTLTVLTLRGYIVSHEWADNNYIMHVNPLLEVNPEKDEIESHAPLRERWRDDLQLLSDYLDFKSTRTSEGGRYVSESGALTGAIRDYLQALLLLRPQDALHFTRHYFGSALSALDLPHDEYFDGTPKHVRYYFFEN